jgi:Lipocalin-like domain
MKIALLCGALILMVPFGTLAGESDLYGTWKLMSLSRTTLDGGKVEAPRGKAPRGYVSFTPEGRVLGFIVNEQRPKPQSVEKMTDKERLELFNSMNAYAGTYELNGNKLTYRFDLTHNEVTERASVREIKFDARRLTMLNEPAKSAMDGKMVQTTTVWEKVAGGAAAKK